MTPAKIASLERGLNATVRKVLDATPIQKAWSVHAIGSELSRTGKRLELSMIVGCLNALKRDGLAKEPDPGHFMRVAAEPRITLVPHHQESAVPRTLVSTPEPTSEPALTPAPVDPFADLATLAADLLELSDKADRIAGALRMRIAEVESQVAKFKQFQELLKGMA